MNDFQMSTLASSHSSTLLDEARRQRLATSAGPRTRQSRPARARRSLRLGLGSLLGRASA